MQQDVISKEQRTIRKHLGEEVDLPREKVARSSSHGLMLKGFQHGVDQVMAALAELDIAAPALGSFRHSAKGMAALVADDNVHTAASRGKSMCAGAEAAMAVAQDKEASLRWEVFRMGARAVTSLLSEEDEVHRVQMEGFLWGAEKTQVLIDDEDD